MTDARSLLVTGASRGIGASVARLAAKAGYRVAVNFVSGAEAAAGVVRDIEAEGGEAFAIRADIGEERDVLSMFGAVDERYGRLDALVNNAGVVDRKSRLDEMSAERIRRMMAVNTVGTMLCTREAVRRMSTRHGSKGGVIVNVSSMAAQLGSPSLYVDYAASKGAVDTFTYGLALEVAAEGIRVNGVRPGIIETDIHASRGDPDWPREMSSILPMQRAGHPDEVARAVLYLLSDDASYVTGSILNVSGGR
jgi:NAD(P)-dependent dehydrogenase (short-subunit alcohol dehydrogenase family)